LNLLNKFRKFLANPRRYLNRRSLYEVSRSVFHSLPTGGRAFAPSVVAIVPTPGCNARCAMCDIGQRVKDSAWIRQLKGSSDSPPLTIDQWKAVIDQLSTFRPGVAFAGGEPYLYPHILELCEYLHRKTLDYSNTTNGLLLEQYAEDSVRYGMACLQVSLLGPPRIHDTATGVDGAFNQVIRGIQKLVEAKARLGKSMPKIIINCPMFQANYRHLEEFAGILKDIRGVSSIMFTHQYARTLDMVEKHKNHFGTDYPVVATTDTADLRDVDTTVLLRQLRAVHDILEGKPFLIRPSLTPEQTRMWYDNPSVFIPGHEKCSSVFSSSLIAANGDVLTPLTFCVNCVFGNVGEQPLLKIWNNGKYRRFRKILRKGPFPVCARCCGVVI